MKKTLLFSAVLLTLAVSACTTTPSRLTPEQTTRLETAKAQCMQESISPKVHPVESRNQSAVRTDYFYDCMRKQGITER